MDTKQYKNIDEYIANYPKDIQDILEKLRQVIKKAAPQAQEAISYGMPAFKLDSVLVYFAAQKSHIGFYPTSSGINVFKKELSIYDTSKGTVRFPLDQPLPFKLIEKIVHFRVNEVLDKLKK